MRNIYFIQIQNLIDGKVFLPTALGYLWSYLLKEKELMRSYKLADCLFLRDEVEDFVKEIFEPSVICISTYVWNFECSKKIASTIKEKYPNCLIIVGGPHVPYEIGFNTIFPYFDLVITYEGEEILAKVLLENLKEVPVFDQIPGVITSTSKTVKKASRISNISLVSSPCLNGFYDKLLSKYKNIKFNLVIETNRGCPYSCTFCDMQDSIYQKLTLFEMERVKQEIFWAVNNKIEYIDCADSNFGIFERDIEIAKYIAQMKTEYGYPKMFNFTSAKNQPEHVRSIQSILGKVGIDRGISVSLQSLDENVQKNIKRYNLSDERIKEVIDIYKAEDLEFFIELIIGLPGESKRSWMDGLGIIMNMDQHLCILIHPLSIVPNTPFSNELYIEEHGLKYTTTRSPAQGFNYGNESSEEREQICYQSQSMERDEWIDSYVYGKSFVGALYSHGIIYYILLYLKKECGLEFGYFLEKLFEYASNSTGVFAKEYKKAVEAVRESLFGLRPWGRIVMNDGFYWSDQAATAINFMANIDGLYDELESVIIELAPKLNKNSLESVMMYNKKMLESPYSRANTTNLFQYDWKSYFESNDELKNIPVYYDFQGREWNSPREHALHVYWYGRKSIRCFKNVVEVYPGDL